MDEAIEKAGEVKATAVDVLNALECAESCETDADVVANLEEAAAFANELLEGINEALAAAKVES